MNYLNSFKTTLLTLVIFSLISSLCVHTSFGEDADSDQIPDVIDNCPTHYNPAQADTYPPQRNGIGDACDCEANFDCDTDVDARDVTIFLADFGRCRYFRPCSNQDPCNGDFQCDQDVDATDVTKFLEDFGRNQYYNPCPICPGKPWCVYCTDSDEDGFTSEGGACGPVDCDDGDDTLYPGATEICEDTIDQDCDGEDLFCILVDGDGDLWASSQGDCCDTGGEISLGCSLETRGEIFPGATDFPGDGIDQDCDGIDDLVPGQEDFDHDGLSFTAGDCNDRIPTVHPGAVEILCNDIDEDCNGSDSCRITPTEESYSGYITGEVFNATTFEPLPGAKVLVQGQGELTTDAQG